MMRGLNFFDDHTIIDLWNTDFIKVQFEIVTQNLNATSRALFSE